VGPSGINVHDWEVCHRESRIRVSSGCPDTFDQIVYVVNEKWMELAQTEVQQLSGFTCTT
jgi:hypothetical protein